MTKKLRFKGHLAHNDMLYEKNVISNEDEKLRRILDKIKKEIEYSLDSSPILGSVIFIHLKKIIMDEVEER